MTGGASAQTTAGQTTLGTGGGGSHPNLQPYLTTNFAIKWRMSASASDETQITQRLNTYDAIDNGGTAAQRNAIFGVPATAAARLALHLKMAQWKRVDKGWTEQYFATLADGASQANGAVSVAGWYPVFGVMPFVALTATSNYSYNGATATRIAFDTLLSSVGNDMTYTLGSAALGGSMTLGLAGRYHSELHLNVSSPNITYIDAWLRKNDVDFTAITENYLNTGYSTSITDVQDGILVATGDRFQYFVTPGNTISTINRVRGTRFSMRYTGPPFVNSSGN